MAKEEKPDVLQGALPQQAPLGTPTRAMDDLLGQYEAFTGVSLKKLDPAPKRKRPDGVMYEWPWSWEPEWVGSLLQSWTNSLYFLHPMMRDLATTLAPDGRTMMFERVCTQAVKDAITNIINLGQAPAGAIPPVPKGTYSIDLRRCPPNTRPQIFTLNYWHFSGMVPNISRDVWEMLTMMHGAWFSEQWRAREGYENPTINLGEIGRRN